MAIGIPMHTKHTHTHKHKHTHADVLQGAREDSEQTRKDPTCPSQVAYASKDAPCAFGRRVIKDGVKNASPDMRAASNAVGSFKSVNKCPIIGKSRP